MLVDQFLAKRRDCYGSQGILTHDGRGVFEYDPPHKIAVGSLAWQTLWTEHTALMGDALVGYLTGQENQLTNVYVASTWRESMKYDAFGRKRVLQQHSSKIESSFWGRTPWRSRFRLLTSAATFSPT
jgi:hypothetical protein